jgi:hypothetical protein
VCESVCYARTGRFRTQLVQSRLQANLDACLLDGFEDRIVKEIRRRGIHTVRVHVAGDFFSADYAGKWVRIARRCRQTRFYCYTRSWRVTTILPALAEFASLKNSRVWWSVDAETGIPEGVPANVQLAFLQREGSDDPHGARVVFRVRHLQNTPARRIGLATVCPNETGLPQAADVTCTSCRRCIR